MKKSTFLVNATYNCTNLDLSNVVAINIHESNRCLKIAVPENSLRMHMNYHRSLVSMFIYVHVLPRL